MDKFTSSLLKAAKGRFPIGFVSAIKVLSKDRRLITCVGRVEHRETQPTNFAHCLVFAPKNKALLPTLIGQLSSEGQSAAQQTGYPSTLLYFPGLKVPGAVGAFADG